MVLLSLAQMAQHQLEPSIVAVLPFEQDLRKDQVRLQAHTGKGLPKFQREVGVDDLPVDPALGKIRLVVLLSQDQAPGRVKEDAFAQLIVLEGIPYMDIRQRPGEVGITDDAVIPLQTDHPVLVRHTGTHTLDQHLAVFRMLPGVLQLHDPLVLLHAFHGLVDVVVIAVIDPVIPMAVALLRREGARRAHHPAHVVIRQHLTAPCLGVHPDLPQAHAQRGENVVIVRPQQRPEPPLIALLPDPVDQEAGQDAHLGVVLNGIARVVDADESDKGAIQQHRDRDETGNVLFHQHLPFGGAGISQGIQVRQDDRAVLPEQPQPALQRRLRHPLSAPELRQYIVPAPLPCLAPPLLLLRLRLKQVSPVGLVELPHQGQKAPHRAGVVCVFRQALAALHHFIGKVQLFPQVLTDDLVLGDVQRHFHPRLSAPIGEQLVLEKEMPSTVLIHLIPDVKNIRLQILIGAEGTGLVPALKGLIALFPAVVPQSQQLLPRRIQIIELVGLQVADIEDVALRVHDRPDDLILRPLGDGHPVVVVHGAPVALLPSLPGPERLALRPDIELLKLLHAAGAGKQEALEQTGPQLLHHRQLLGGLDALTAHPDPAALRQLDHVAQQAEMIGAVLDVAHKAPVDLDLIHLHLLEPAQAGIACPKIVDGNGDAVLLPPAEDLVEVGIVEKLNALRELHGQRAAGQPAASEDLQDLFRDVLLPQLGIGHVEADAEFRDMRPPFPALCQGVLQHPQTHGADQLCLLQDGHEFLGAHVPPAGRAVPQQRLGPVEPVAVGVHLGLIVQGKTIKPPLDAPPEVLLELQRRQVLFVVVSGEKPQGILSVGLGIVHGIFRILKEGIHIGDLVGLEGDAAARQGTALLQPAPELREDLHHHSGALSRQIHREAVAVRTVDPLLAAGGGLQGLRHPFEHLVPKFLTVFQVDGLLIVHVHQQQVAVLLLFQEPTELLLPHIHVEGARQAVRLASGHRVGNPSDHPHRPAPLILLDLPPAADPHDPAPPVEDPILRVIGAQRPAFQPPDPVLERRKILGMDDPIPVLQGTAAVLVPCHAVTLSHGPRKIEPPGAEVQQKEILLRPLAEKVQDAAVDREDLFHLPFMVHFPHPFVPFPAPGRSLPGWPGDADVCPLRALEVLGQLAVLRPDVGQKHARHLVELAQRLHRGAVSQKLLGGLLELALVAVVEGLVGGVIGVLAGHLKPLLVGKVPAYISIEKVHRTHDLITAFPTGARVQQSVDRIKKLFVLGIDQGVSSDQILSQFISHDNVSLI